MRKNFKNITAIVMMGLAVLLMLGTTVIPHHHDQHGVCFDVFEDKGIDSCEDSNTSESHTDRESQCTLAINYYPAQENDKLIHCCCDGDQVHDHSLEYGWCVYSENISYIHSKVLKSKMRFLTSDEYLYSAYIKSTVGERAPPVFVA